MWTQSTSVTDGWTDRQTDGRTDRITITETVLRIASHGKNRSAIPLRELKMLTTTTNWIGGGKGVA